MDANSYKKRTGTSGISGQLFETKLVSLILFRLLHDEDVQEFHLASNMDEVGAFDDIIFRAKIKGLAKPILVFVQAKHKEEDDVFLSYDLIKHFHESFVKVKDNFYAGKEKVKGQAPNVLFKGKLEEIECLFILYTNAKFYEDSNSKDVAVTATNANTAVKPIRKTYESSFAERLSSLIGTGVGISQGSQTDYTEQDLEVVNEKIVEEEIRTIGEHFAKFLNDQSMNIMLDKYIILYHAMLAQSAVKLSEIKSEEIKTVKKAKVKKGGQKPEQVKPKQNKPEQNSETKADESERGKQIKNISDKNKSIKEIPDARRDEIDTNITTATNALEELTTSKPSSSKDMEARKQSLQNKPDDNDPGDITLAKSEDVIARPEEFNIEIRRYRLLTFPDYFFITDDKKVTVLRNKLYETVINTQLKNKKKPKETSKDDTSTTNNSNESMEEKHISAFLSEPSPTTLSPLIGTSIIYNTKVLEFIVERPSSDLQKLEEINTSQKDLTLTVQEAEIIAAKNILTLLKLKVPATFGNLDITIAGDSNKVEKRLDTLTEFIEKLCQKAILVGSYNIVTIDKSVGEGFLSLTGGIGSAVGTLLIYDKVTKLLKFAEVPPLADTNARKLFDKLQSKINILTNFASYRFDTKDINNFPLLEFDFADAAKGILNKVVVYEKQSNHNGVEKILKEVIGNHESTNELQRYEIKPEKLAIYYHNEIQKWWMLPIGKYFKKSSDIYKEAINNIITEPQISALQTTFCLSNINKYSYDFHENALNLFPPIVTNSRTIIVSKIPILTAIKIIQILIKENNKCAVLDLECLLNFPVKDFSALNIELKNTDKVQIFICDCPKSNRMLHKRLDTLAEATAKKKIIVITTNTFAEMAEEYFENSDAVVRDESQSLIDFTAESRADVVQNSSVIFQGDSVNLGLLVDDKSAAFVKGVVLKKIISNEVVRVGAELSNPNYEKIKYLYVERKVLQAPHDRSGLRYDYIHDESRPANKPKGHFVRRFSDIDEDAVLITADPGMGKSTLLTRLSLKTKENTKELWIVRINLLDHSKTFFDWQTHDIDINILATLNILCHVIIKNNNLRIRFKESLEKVYLEGSTGDDETDFELNMFLHFYNEKELLFLFDGFDEICPHYKKPVLDFLRVVMNYPRCHKMWVTSRPYSEILPTLQGLLGTSYELQYISDFDQQTYLYKYWHRNLKIENLHDVQIAKVISYIDFMNPRNSPTIPRTFHIFYAYVCRYFPHIKKYDLANMVPVRLNPQLTDFHGGLVERRVDIMTGTPLLLYLYASYFVSVICDEPDIVNWKLLLEESGLNIYEKFIETKLKILFQDKNEMDIYKPDIVRQYEKDYIDCVNLHKKIAAHNLFFHRIRLEELKELHPFKEEDDYEDAIKKIKCGIEKIGLVSHVTADNLVVFIYKTLEEYFATEYLCDLFKDENVPFSSKNMLYSIANVTLGIFPWLNRKKSDNELNAVLREIEYHRPFTVSVYAHLFATGSCSLENLIRIRSSSADDYEPDCFTELHADYFKVLRRLEPEERDIKIREFQVKVVQKMKPHFQQHFMPTTRELMEGIYRTRQFLNYFLEHQQESGNSSQE